MTSLDNFHDGEKMKFLHLCIVSFIFYACSEAPVTKEIVKKEDELRPHKIRWTKKSENELMKEYNFKKQDIGYVLYDSHKKKILKSHDPHELFTPASVMKLLTANYVLWRFPPDYRFLTTVKGDGELKKDEFTGDLYLVGGGDPLLMSHHLMELCVNLHQKINKFKGKFYFDESLFDPHLEIEETQGDEDSYNSPLSSLTSDFNLFQFNYHYNSHDNAMEYYYFPEAGQKFFLSERKDGASWDAVDLDDTHWHIPMMKSSGKERLPLRQAARATALKMQNFCGKIGLHLPEPEAKVAPLNAKVWSTHRSLPLSEVINLGMEYSNNLVFESLLMNASKKKNLEEASLAMSEFYLEKIKSKDSNKIVIKNGSGLSHDNKITPQFLLDVLKLWGDDAVSYMPISGIKGTLAHRLYEPPMNMNIWAKTGTMDYVSSLAGNLFSSKGKNLQFVIMINNKSSTSISKDLFREKARKIQDDLLELWWHEN